MSNSQSELSKASSPSSSNRRDEWTVEQSARLYNVKGWGEPYFAIDRQGNVTVTPQGEKGQSIKLLDLIESLTLQGIDSTVVDPLSRNYGRSSGSSLRLNGTSDRQL